MENEGAEPVAVALLPSGFVPKVAAVEVVSVLLVVSPVANTGVKLNLGAA